MEEEPKSTKQIAKRPISRKKNHGLSFDFRFSMQEKPKLTSLVFKRLYFFMVFKRLYLFVFIDCFRLECGKFLTLLVGTGFGSSDINYRILLHNSWYMPTLFISSVGHILWYIIYILLSKCISSLYVSSCIFYDGWLHPFSKGLIGPICDD
jgi:hypothetical protein